MKYTQMRLMLFFGLLSGALMGQTAPSAAAIQHDLDKLQYFRKVLYIAAHPDDENTRAIAWFSNEKMAHTAYLSLTRGDGGQNLVGPELGSALGLLRSQELLKAREIDGGKQFFTRAVDFGYSKSADESFEKWGKEEVLSDVVRVIRTFQPDIIVTRFPPDRRAGHGHHTASAMLAIEAFTKAADPKAFPDQLQTLDTWQAHCVYWNTSRWWVGGLDTIAPNDPTIFSSDIGGYSSVLGVSFNELGSIARSQHKSQGFGVAIDRGRSMEYFEHLAGARVDTDFFEEEFRTWSTIGADMFLGDLANDIMKNFNAHAPEESLPQLIQLREGLRKLPASHWRNIKINEVEDLIVNCSGLYLDARAENYAQVTTSFVDVTVQALARTTNNVQVKHFQIGTSMLDTIIPLEKNIRTQHTLSVRVPDQVSNPYWLHHPFEGLFVVEDYSNIGKPQNDPTLTATITLEINGTSITRNIPVRYVWSDRVHGELTRPFLATPAATVNFEKETYVFAQHQASRIGVKVKTFQDRFSSNLQLTLPLGWTCEPKAHLITLNTALEETTLFFDVTPPASESIGNVFPVLTALEKPVYSFQELNYEHIEPQNWFPPAKAKVVRVQSSITSGAVGYIQGAGDEVSVGLSQMGFDVIELNEEKLAKADLSQFKAIVIGIRAYNTNAWLPNYHNQLNAFVKNGGNLIVQYNTTTSDLLTTEIGPYAFRISRDRVTEENAVPRLISPEHAIWQHPNTITSIDFEGWVQERGLYFADQWAPELMPMISWADSGETPKSGGLLIGNYGKGAFVYTGISFFRQIPAGVPGAYRILANLISYQQ